MQPTIKPKVELMVLKLIDDFNASRGKPGSSIRAVMNCKQANLLVAELLPFYTLLDSMIEAFVPVVKQDIHDVIKDLECRGFLTNIGSGLYALTPSGKSLVKDEWREFAGILYDEQKEEEFLDACRNDREFMRKYEKVGFVLWSIILSLIVSALYISKHCTLCQYLFDVKYVSFVLFALGISAMYPALRRSYSDIYGTSSLPFWYSFANGAFFSFLTTKYGYL